MRLLPKLGIGVLVRGTAGAAAGYLSQRPAMREAEKAYDRMAATPSLPSGRFALAQVEHLSANLDLIACDSRHVEQVVEQASYVP